ncbi:neoverrucotoxin subunit beta-like [Clupea harengus]|uniref:Neoverrucotoxin subunit beta-like n=1 Tax=Clupea harengus TaxID=7950 RepID=A0A8M1KBV2_CLUHA|nr:neoverrucotoxin subunit beta-like [Clupea harengus]
MTCLLTQQFYAVSTKVKRPEFSVLVVSALSRPLDLGTLYNARNDRLIPGISLWKTEDMKSKTHVSPQPSTRFQVTGSESLSDKTSLLDVSASLKVSFLGGLVEVGGSAKYLNKKTSSSRQCSVTLGYHVTTEIKELMISELQTPNPELFDMTDATHVVSQVLYGADALMEFQEMASDDSEKQEIQGKLHVMIKKIPLVDISGDGSLNMDDEDKKRVQNFSCKFFGDFYLKDIPSTYEEAVKVYKQLPSLLGEKEEKAVPVKVWLYPLSKLTNTESKLKRMISERLVSAVEKVMDDFHRAEMRTNDLLKSSNEIKAKDIVHKLEMFQSSLRVFTTEFLRKMAGLIPAIRGADLEETALRDLLKSKDASGFSGKEMEQWLDGKETEINVVTMNIKQLNCEIKPPGPALESFLMHPDVKDVFVFSFTSLSYEEPYLKTITKAVENFKSGSTSSTPEQDPTQEVPWYRRPDVYDNLASSRSVFDSASFKNKLTLDPNRADKRLLLSEGNRKVTAVREEQPYPDHPDRFTHCLVLSREPLTERCYWECECDGDYVGMGVAYQSINRDSYINESDKAWALLFSEKGYSVVHNKCSADFPAPPSRSSRVGVFLDREAGTLSFYSVCSDTLTLLHTFNITFTDEPLYAAFFVEYDTSVTLC